MKRAVRLQLDPKAVKYLSKRQENLNVLIYGGLQIKSVDAHWAASRKTKAVKGVLGVLKSMMGEYERCMYCMDSHGCDIEHFNPKSLAPEYTYLWDNMLLCCTECGRIKGVQYPCDNGTPLLIDPTRENPWDYLDFDPELGVITARFNPEQGTFFSKGLATVETFRLDKREALQAVYKRAYKHLCVAIHCVLGEEQDVDSSLRQIIREDYCGFAGWVFSQSGKSFDPINRLPTERPDVWSAGTNLFSSS